MGMKYNPTTGQVEYVYDSNDLGSQVPDFMKKGIGQSSVDTSIPNTNYNVTSAVPNTPGYYNPATINNVINPDGITPPTEPGFMESIGNYATKNAEGIQALSGIGQLGLGLASFMQNKKVAKKQMNLMDQQIAQNQQAMNNRSAFLSQLGSNV